MKGNIHKKLTQEDKFGRKYFCKNARKFIRHQKKENNKKIRKILKAEINKLNI